MSAVAWWEAGFVMKRISNLFDKVVSFDNLFTSWRKARRGAGKSPQSLAFEFTLEKELLRLRDELSSGSWTPGGYRTFTIREPKPRLIAEAPFRDRVVHHAVVGQLEPFFERLFIFDSYATRKGKGTHKALVRAQSFLRKNGWYLQADIRQYFASIKIPILLSLLEARIDDGRMLALLEKILLCDPEQPGLPIGNLTSQFLANVYLDPFDHHVKERMHAGPYLRYMDDFVLFGKEKSALVQAIPELTEWLSSRLQLEIKPGSVRVNQACHGLSFLGMRVFPGLMRLRRENLKRSLKHLMAREQQYRKGLISEDKLARCGQSVLSHIKSADSLQLRMTFSKGASSMAARTV
jgi:RNA-directed DNA polymerase